MSLGCPIICSDVKAQKTLLRTYNVGLLFRASDFTEKLFKLYLNSSLRNQLSKNCIDAIQNHLNNDIISKDLVKYYE